jgi:hypothetical protein
MAKAIKTFQDIKPGDRITITVHAGIGRNGPEKMNASGKVVIITRENNYDHSSPISHVALNMGGRFGTPGVATPKNFVGFGNIK